MYMYIYIYVYVSIYIYTHDSYGLDASESASTWHRTHSTHWRVCVTVTR